MRARHVAGGRAPALGRAASRVPALALGPALGLALAGVALAGCETTADKSARLERAAKLKGPGTAAKGLSIARPSRILKVADAAVVGGSEGAAVVVTVRNAAARAAHDVPIAVTVTGAGGATAYTNAAPGLAHTLVSIPFVPAHGATSWVDDQLPARATGGRARAVIGEAPGAGAGAPALSVSGTRAFEDPTNGPGEEGTVANRSAVGRHEVVVYALARRGGRIVAAGRAVLPEVAAGASTRFQVFWVGDAAGASVQATAAPAA